MCYHNVGVARNLMEIVCHLWSAQIEWSGETKRSFAKIMPDMEDDKTQHDSRSLNIDNERKR